MQITFTIPADKVLEFKNAFLKAHGIPVNANREPSMTVEEWIKLWGKQQFLNAYKEGKRMLAEEQMQINEGIIT